MFPFPLEMYESQNAIYSQTMPADPDQRRTGHAQVLALNPRPLSLPIPYIEERESALSRPNQLFLFRRTLPVAVEAGVAFAAVVFFIVPAPVTPLRILPMTPVFFVGGGASLFSEAFAVLFFTTVDVLPSLDSLMPLILRALAVAASLTVPDADDGPYLLPPAVPVAELAVVDVEALARFPPASFRVERAFSAQLLRRFDALLFFTGDFGVAAAFSDAGMSRVRRALPPDAGRGTGRTLVEAGDRTLDALVASLPIAGFPRGFLLGASEPSDAPSFSLLSPEISSLGASVRARTWKDDMSPHLVLLGGLPGPPRDAVVA